MTEKQLLAGLRDALKGVDAGVLGATDVLIKAVRVILDAADDEDSERARLKARWELEKLRVPSEWLDAFVAAYDRDVPLHDKTATGASLWLDRSSEWRSARASNLAAFGAKDGAEALAFYEHKVASRSLNAATNLA